MSWCRAAFLAGLLAGTLQIAAASIEGASAAVVVSRSPFGLSVEYPLLERALGPGPCPSPALVAAIQQLGTPSLRVGGDSQDLAGPSTAYHYYVPPTFWTTLGCLVRETGVQVTVGLNFATAPLTDALTTVSAAEQAIPAAQLSFSLGNEPDLYGISHILPNEPSFTVPAFRSSPWTAKEFVAEWDSRRAALGPIPIEGPDFAGSHWASTIARQLAADPPTTFSVHDYPTSACGAGALRTTAARVLSRHASVGLLSKYDWLLRIARATGRALVVSESNSASCGGQPGVSNTPVAGIWAVRFVISALLEGFAQVRFHSAGTSYDPFVFNPDGTITMRPLAHALLFLHRWIPIGSEIASSAHNPKVLAASVSTDGHTSMIVSSFATKPLPFTIAVPTAAASLATDTLTSASSVEAPGSVAVSGHRARLLLAPNTVVAIETS
jgi:hypothetical protein